MRNLVLLKLGGSVITNKNETPPEINENAVRRIAKELKHFSLPLVIVLGGGAHGHQAAHSFGYGNPSTPISRLLLGIPSIRHNMSELSHNVETLLSQEGISSVVISPFSISLLNDRKIESFSLETIWRTINSGHNIITHGDVCYDSKHGAAILSGDTIMTYLAKALDIKNLLIGTDVDGVLDGNPKQNPNARIIPIINQHNRESILESVGTSNAIDVTGGMARKVEDLLSLSGLGIEATIFNLTVPGRLVHILKGVHVPCTKVIP